MLKPQRILFVLPSFPNPNQPFVDSHVSAMLRKGWQVGVCSRAIDRPRLQQLQSEIGEFDCWDLSELGSPLLAAKGLRRHWQLIRTFGTRYWSLFPKGRHKKLQARASALLHVAREFRPDVMHAHFGDVGLIASPVATKLSIPLSISYHGDDLLDRGFEQYNPHRGITDSSTAIVYSEFMRGVAAERLNSEVVKVNFGVNRELFCATEVAPSWGKPIELLIVGRLIDYKGQHVALHALKELEAQAGHRSFRLTLVGDGPAREALESLTAELGVNARFVGQSTQSEVAGYLRDSDIVLIPSLSADHGWQETFCLVALEALSCGKCVVAADTGALPETIGSGGRIVVHNDATALATAITEQVSEESPRSCTERALARAAEFSVERMALEYDEIARRLAESSGSHTNFQG